MRSGSGDANGTYKQQVSGFNVFGEPAGETVTIPTSEGGLAGTYAFTHIYSTNTGLPFRDRLPAGGGLPFETLTHGYSGALDVPNSLAGSSSYATSTTWNAYSQVYQEDLGTTAIRGTITNAYDENTGALLDSSLTNTALSSSLLDHLTYTYDKAGNPTSQTETKQGGQSETQCFGYDGLDRLSQAWTATDGCAADPSTNGAAGVGDGITAGAYWTTWTFNPLGQRQTQTQHGLGGATPDTTTGYVYDGNGAAQPHTLTSTATTGGTTAATSYTYNADGSIHTRTTPGQGQQSLTWDQLGRLTAVTGASGGSSYIYDADGNLLLQKDPGHTTLYLPGEQLTLDTSGTTSDGTVTGQRFYSLPGGGEAVRTGTGTNYSYELADLHGTQGLNINAALDTATLRQFTPYGDTRGTAPTAWPDNHGFLNKVDDTTTGLTDVGARWYDPTTATFASLDPLFEATSSQQQNGYTYAASNPTTNSDPTGLKVCGAPGLDPCSKGQNPATGTKYQPGSDKGPDGQQQNVAPSCDSICQVSISPILGHRPNSRALNALRSWGYQGSKDFTVGDAEIFFGFDVLPGKATQAWEWFCDMITGNGNGCEKTPSWLPKLGTGTTPYKVLTGAAMIVAAGMTAAVLSESVAAAGPAIGTCVAEWVACGSAAAKAGQIAGGALVAAFGGGEDPLAMCSFAAGTPILMADGRSEPINKVKAGDKIDNAPPGARNNSKDETHTVEAVHTIYTDRDFTDVTIATPDGPQTITGTSHHLYWDATTRAWTRADHLHPGDHLQTTAGHTTTITALHSYTNPITTYDLTINSLHTYYVEAGTTPVLVHNCPPGISGGQAAQEGGAAYEIYLHDALGGGGNFSEGGREFDGAFVNPANGEGTWYEAKSGGYWDRLLSNPRSLSKFYSTEGQKLSLANGQGVGYMIVSDRTIPGTITDWLDAKGIPWTVMPTP